VYLDTMRYHPFCCTWLPPGMEAAERAKKGYPPSRATILPARGVARHRLVENAVGRRPKQTRNPVLSEIAFAKAAENAVAQAAKTARGLKWARVAELEMELDDRR
jgi:hypothetical protein